MTSAYSFEIRVLTCPVCGAPVQVSPVGGSVTCDHCRNSIQIQPRPLPTPTGPPPDEEQRRAALLEQQVLYLIDALEWPDDFAEIARTGVNDSNLAAATSMWQTYCRAAASGDQKVGDYAVLLTAPLATYYSQRGDEEHKRAIFETTLEALPRPAHQQVMRCRLARAALKAGDVDAARAWVSSCDPASLDLAADSDYRISAAMLATFDQDFAAVLRYLGRTNDEIPTSSAIDLLALVVRANALEKSGNLEAAVAILLTYAAHSDGTLAQDGMVATVKANAYLDLCPRSVPEAIAALPKGRGQFPGVPAEPEPKRRGLFARHKS